MMIRLTPDQRALFRDARKQKDLSVSGVPGVRGETVNNIEKGYYWNRHHIATVEKLARALGLPPGTLAAHGVKGFTVEGSSPDSEPGDLHRLIEEAIASTRAELRDIASTAQQMLRRANDVDAKMDALMKRLEEQVREHEAVEVEGER